MTSSKSPSINLRIQVDAMGRNIQPQPITNGKGASIIGPRNLDRERQNPDAIRAPITDHGTMANMKWSFAGAKFCWKFMTSSFICRCRLPYGKFWCHKCQSDMCMTDSHMHIEEGGWARQTTIRELPTSIELAGVNMRLEEGAVRELHWHKEVTSSRFLVGNLTKISEKFSREIWHAIVRVGVYFERKSAYHCSRCRRWKFYWWSWRRWLVVLPHREPPLSPRWWRHLSSFF